ncbi:alpha-rhamnosidase [Pelobium manganitolerans]|uniref:alpha-L-rhamnosidase n=1 Tax=Pelobium manganitolerans TaxID=1842495 RepID=A0A419SAX7_9SPHI|nr:alpha-L-rhamnosidase [Pelobium manganitolerans]RKD19611.1 alpha-rhamnosidase [Pelobium manganitolerans]
MTKRFIILSLLIFGFYSLKAQVLQVTALKVEQLVNPLGIDVKQPNLSWQIVSQKRGVGQKAYQVLVASSAEKLAQNEGDLWNTGKVNSSESIYVKYNGKELTSRGKCFWKVKIWTNVGESEWSKTNFWTMGLLYYKDWPKAWIGFDRAFPWDSIENASRLSARYFRKEFENKKEVKSATVSIVGLGLYELFINGKKVSDDVLAPSSTDYTKNVKANTYDVTSYLQNGKNAVGAVLGNGRFFAMRQNEKPYKIKTFGFPKMLLNLHIVYTDGTSTEIETDNSWKGTADGPIRTNNEYDGEEYDATKEFAGWNKIGFDDSKWLQAEYVQEPSGTIEAQMNENMKVMKTLQPVSITKLSGRRYILDMGQNMVGWLQIKVKGKKGQQIKLRFAESLEDNGELFTANLRNAKNTDLYTLKGGEEETWEPTFVYRGFRFVELSGYTYQPKVADFVGKMVYDNIETVGTFESSNALLNQIFKNAWWGIAGNYKGMPLDCPQRNERMPWLGDRGEVAYGENFVFDNERIYTKWLEDIRNSQKEDGAIPDVAPAFWRYYSDNMTWAGTIASITDMLYTQTGNVQVVKDNYPAIKKWLAYMQDRYMENYIMTKDSYGDWCAPPITIEAGRGKSADKKYPSQLISTAYHYHFLKLMMEYSKLTGNENDYSQFEILAQKVKDAFNQKFYNDKGFYGDNKLTDNIIPLYFGMVPQAETDKVFRNIVYTVEVTNNGHLSNGLVGIQWLMRCLNDYGRPDLAYTIATQKTYPSWGYMIENGATTIWELWNGNTAHPRMNSQNHVMMLGDLLIWYYENLAGIKAEISGFKEILMKPETSIAGLNYVNASFDSPFGKIKSNWKRDKKTFNWNISIPANTSATVYLPASNQKSISESGKNITNQKDIEFIRKDGDKMIYKINSGNYAFQIKK